MRLLSLRLTDLHLLSYQPAVSRSGKKRRMNVEGPKTMMEMGERLMAGLRRGRSWDACMGQERRRRLSQQVASLKGRGLSFRFHV